MSGGVLQMLGALAVTLGLMALALALLKRVQGGGLGRGGPVEVLQRVPLGPRQGLALVRVAGRVLVIGMAESGVRTLAELTAEEWAASGASLAREGEPQRGRFQISLPGLGKIGLFAALLLVGAGHASAQTAPGVAPVTAPSSLASAPVASASKAAAPATLSTRITPPAKTPAPPAPVVNAPAAGPIVRAVPAFSVNGPAPPQVDVRIGEGNDALHLSGAVGLVIFIGVLTLLPALFLLMTSFTRILIVLHFLRSALGTQTAPPTQLLVAFAVLLTGVVMHPVLQESQRVALQPYMEGRIDQVQAYQLGVQPFREFMLANTREQDLQMFTEMSGIEHADSAEALPIVTVVSAFVTSELRTSFQMGFLIFLPFVVVDVIVASVLMSLGMFMLPPVMISLPFKLLLFVLADGWTLVVQNLVSSFR
ncbi:MAG TPA: flagellar type III secretion system pore protein FliP [Candidatus Sulfotelmatobacter sp.]|nr:flagellar type III secretion system pore protein FliP [Candidatus Sulfotelmatobacter sp.]